MYDYDAERNKPSLLNKMSRWFCPRAKTCSAMRTR